MAKKFIYPNANLYDVTPVGGEQTSSSENFGVTADVTNEHRLTDVSISTAAGFPANFDAVRFDLSASGNSFDTIALYANATDTDNVLFYSSSADATGVFNSSKFLSGSEFSNTFAVGWNVQDLVSTSSNRYVFMKGQGELNIFTEVLLGTTLEFPFNPNLNSKESKQFGVDVVESYGGNEYANKRHDGKRMWEVSFSNLTEANKTSFESMRDAVSTNFLKFLYYDDSSYYWVRALKGSFDFTEVAYQSYNMNVKMIEQLA